MAGHKPINYNNIPTELKALPQWVWWLGEPKSDGKLNKKPMNANNGKAASHSNPKTWASFGKAQAYHESHSKSAGIGFVFSAGDPYVGIDLDNCRNLETGEIATWALELIQLANTYSEVSPSGKGVKLWIKGKMPGDKGKRNDHYETGGIEIYPHHRFFTVTGQHLDGTPLEIVENQAAIEAIYFRAFAQMDKPEPKTTRKPTEPVTDDDKALIEKAIANPKNGDKFRRLWKGDFSDYHHEDGTPDQSRADLALCSYLAFWTQGDTARIDKLFRQSGLMREKWDRDDYRKRTIQKAIANADAYDPNYQSKASSNAKQQKVDGEPKSQEAEESPKADFQAILKNVIQAAVLDPGYERAQAMKSIFEKMLSLDATEQSTLIGKMRDVKLGTKADLERQLRDVAKAVEQAETAKTQAAKEKVESEDESRSAGGLHESTYHYYKYVMRGDDYVPTPISSFIIQPNLRVWMDGKENLTADFVTATETYSDVVIRRRDWNGRDRFMDSFPSVDLQWEGQLNDIQHVLAIVASYDVPTKQGTTQLGRHDSGLWLLPDGTAYNSEGLVDDSDLVYLPLGGRGELDDKIGITELDDKSYQELLVGIYSNIFTLNLRTVIIPTIGWFMSTPFKPLVQQKYRGFPLLSVSGRTGAGKSSLLDLMWELMGIGGSGGKLFSCTETDFVILKLLSSTTSIPLVFDEYKPFDMPPLRLKALTRMLRKCYDGEKELRGRPDQTTTEYSLSAPVAIAGEVPLTEGALLERIVTVSLSKNKLNNIMRKAYGAMRGLNLSAFMSRYIPFCLSTDFDKELNRAEVLTTDLIPGFDDIADRIRKNLVVMTFGFNQFMRFGKEFDIDCGDLTPALAEALIAAKNTVCGED